MKESDFDVVIIGAGVSGLTSAALLTKAGLKVIVLERHHLIGGYLQGFSRKGFSFDTAIHWLNQCGDKGTVTKVFEYIGNDFPRPLIMETIHTHKTDDYTFTLTNNPEILKSKLIEDFPHEKEGIIRFFEAAKVCADISNKFPKFYVNSESASGFEKMFYKIKQLRIIFPIIKYALYGGEEKVVKGLKKFFKDPALLDLFCSEPDLLSCLFPIAWSYNKDYQNPPIGGSKVIPEWLEKYIIEGGSEVLRSAEVVKINVERGTFESVVYKKKNKEYTLKAKHLIAACDLDVLYNKLIDPDLIPKSLINRLNQAEMYSSSLTISVALDCTAESLGFEDVMLYIYNLETKRSEHLSGDPHKSFISILAPSIRDKTLAPEGKGTLNIFVPAWMEYQNNWNTVRNEKGDYVRNDAYKSLKEEFANVIFDRVEAEVCPNLRKNILFYEVATPVTYYRYTKNKGGTMMGTRPGKTNMQLKVAQYKTPIKNLIVGGHWAELGGGVPIAVKAAFNASLMVLKDHNKEEYQKMKSYPKSWD